VERRRLVAMGGGGFSIEPENPLLDEFVLSLARSTRPRVCFVPTASGDAEGFAGFYRVERTASVGVNERSLPPRYVGVTPQADSG
jgi:peptidase E